MQFDVKRARNLSLQGYNGYQIAQVMGVSKTWVYKVVPKKGKPYKIWSEKEMDKVLSRLSRGQSYEQIAKSMHRSKNSIAIKMCRHRGKISEEDLKAAHYIRLALKLGSPTIGAALRAVRKARIF